MNKIDLIPGKKYMFPTEISGGQTQPYDKDFNKPICGIFTGKYEENGNAILISKGGRNCRRGEEWSIPPETIYSCVK